MKRRGPLVAVVVSAFIVSAFFAFLALVNRPDAIAVAFFIVVVVLTPFLIYIVHRLLNVLYLIYAKRFCEKNGFRPVRWRIGMAFNTRGIKTEYSIVQLDCVDSQNQKRFVSLLVWAFGIRKVVKNEAYAESCPEDWPRLEQ